jgi:ABC-type multidrug transport system ATPase subunit
MLLVEGGYVAKWSNRVKNCLCSGRTKRKKTMDKKSTPTQRSSKKRLISINYSSLNSGEHSLNKSINQETVLAEKEKVINNKNMFSFIIQNLIVIYSSLCGGNKVAISKLYLGLKPKERFALVGHSGAGKTTIIKSILNQTPIIDGHILLNNINMSKHIVGLHNKIGYCPQSNSLFDYLTVKETFEFYDKGIVSDIVNDCTSLQESISNRITNLLSVFGLYKYRDSLTKDLSGGNKRKVLFAIALMNNPELILLDEPSTGVDPDSRRLMWRNVLAIYRNKDVKKNNFNMIVATQCFEEAEVLCDNLGWLEKGKFSYIGNSENLKLELSEGYYLKVKFKKPDENEKKMIVEHIQFNQMNNLKKMENFKINEKDLHVINDVTNLEQISYLYYLDSFLDILFNENANVKFLDCFENQVLLVLNVEQQRKAYMFANLLNISEIQHDIIEISIGIQPFETFIIDDVNDDMS